MKHKILITATIIIILLIVVMALAIIADILKTESKSVINNPVTGAIDTAKDAEIKNQILAELKNSYDSKFPDIIEGVVNIVSNTKTTIKSNGKEYLITPPRPKTFYSQSGIKTGMQVKVQGATAGNNINLGTIEEIKK